MEELNEMIKDYLAARDTDFAIMINGDWGCGKSYYIRNEFQEVVTSVECPVRDETKLISYWDKGNEFTRSLWHKIKARWTKEKITYDEKKYYPFYISLYGVSSVEDFNARVTDEFFGLIGKGGNMLSAFLDGKFNVRLPFSSGKLIPHNAVLVFDDLERICLDKISPIEVLGLINSFAEHRHLKVVIVCNEEAFRQKAEDGSVQLQLDDEYRQYKEKTIRFTYTCKADIPAILNLFVEKCTGVYQTYLEEETERILDLFNKGGKGNLRTLKFFVDTYEKIYEFASQFVSERYCYQIYNKLLISTLICEMEYKDGVSKEDLLKLHQPIELHLDDLLEDQNPPALEGAYNENEKATAYDADKIKEKYSPYYDEMVRAPWLVDYIASGALSEWDIKQFVKEQEEECMRLETSPAMQAVEKLKRLNEIDDEEVQPTINQIWQYIAENKYSIKELLNIYVMFIRYATDGVSIVKLTSDKDALFKEAIAKSGNLEGLEQELHSKMYGPGYGTEADSYIARYNQLVVHARKTAIQINKGEYEYAVEMFLKTIEDEDKAVEGVAEYKYGDKSDLSLHGADLDRVYRAIISQPNPKACMIIECVNYLIGAETIRWSKQEFHALQEFNKALKGFVENNPDLPRTMFLRETIKLISNFLKKYDM